MTMEEKIKKILDQSFKVDAHGFANNLELQAVDKLVALISDSNQQAVAEEREKSIRTGFRWGVNYLAKLIDESTLISELYGWKNIVDNCVERALNITKSNLDSLKGDK